MNFLIKRVVGNITLSKTDNKLKMENMVTGMETERT